MTWLNEQLIYVRSRLSDKCRRSWQPKSWDVSRLEGLPRKGVWGGSGISARRRKLTSLWLLPRLNSLHPFFTRLISLKDMCPLTRVTRRWGELVCRVSDEGGFWRARHAPGEIPILLRVFDTLIVWYFLSSSFQEDPDWRKKYFAYLDLLQPAQTGIPTSSRRVSTSAPLLTLAAMTTGLSSIFTREPVISTSSPCRICTS